MDLKLWREWFVRAVMLLGNRLNLRPCSNLELLLTYLDLYIFEAIEEPPTILLDQPIRTN